jgi:DNA-binding MarR family transcriptional regulator
MGSQLSASRYHDPSALEVRETVDQLRQLVRALRLSARQAEKAANLSSAQLFVLQTLGEAPGISLSELADRTFTDPSSVSAVIHHLFVSGLVSRAQDPVDGRKLELRLSRKGSDLLRKSPPMAQQKLIEAVSKISPRDRRVLARSLRAIVESLDLPAGAAPMFFEGTADE